MAAHKEARFSELVTLAFSADQEEARTLWVPLAQQFDRDGPEAAKEYLAAQRAAAYWSGREAARSRRRANRWLTVSVSGVFQSKGSRALRSPKKST